MATKSFTTDQRESYKLPYKTPTIQPLNTNLLPSLRVTTPYGRLQRDSNDPKYRYHLSEKQIGVGPKVTMKTMAFSGHLHQVFITHHLPNPTDAAISAFRDIPCQMSLPIEPFSPKEVVEALALTHVRKASGYELISGKVLKELPKKAIIISLFSTRLSFASYIVRCCGNLRKL
jgi:hypothetical protein